MKQWLRVRLPNATTLKSNRWLAWAGPWLGEPRLWHLNRRGVALGAAIGVFFGFLIPMAQFVLAALCAIVLRANLPMAVVSTLVTNPLTYVPVYTAAYLLGASLLEGDSVAAAATAEALRTSGLLDWVVMAWKPLILGLGIFAIAGSVAAYAGTLLIWSIAVRIQARRRRQRR